VTRLILPFVLFVAVGCGSAAPTGDPVKKITWEQYQKLPPEDRDDPYTLANLDDDARAKLAEKSKKTKK
jgi:hypothetical protein